MKCKFIYEKEEKEFTPINIIFLQNYHEYGQLYVVCSLLSPQFVKIDHLFYGVFIFAQEIKQNIYAFYFTNQSIKIDSNAILFLDAEKEKIRNTFNIIDTKNINILKQEYVKINNIPKYLEIISECMEQKEKIIVLKNIIFYEHKQGVGYKKIKVNQIDKEYIKSFVEKIFICSEYIEIECELAFKNIKIGDFIMINETKYMNKTNYMNETKYMNKTNYMNETKYRIMYIYHNFLEKKTVLKLHLYVTIENFRFINTKVIPESKKILNEIEICVPACIENNYLLEISR